MLDRSNTRNNNFDFLRFVLAFLVIFSHSFILLGSDHDPLYQVSHGQTFFGRVAVEMFFFISGFLITRSWLNTRNTVDYLKKRILRIYPGYIAAFLLSVFVFGVIGALEKSTYLHTIRLPRLFFGILLLHAPPLLPTFTHNPSTFQSNGSMWTIAIEFQCYITVLILGCLGLLRKTRLVLALFTACLILQMGLEYTIPGLHTVSHHLPAFIQFKLRLFIYFFAGMLFLLLAHRIPYQRQLLYGSLVLLFICLLTTGWNVVFPICGGYALLYTAFSSKLKAQQ